MLAGDCDCLVSAVRSTSVVLVVSGIEYVRLYVVGHAATIRTVGPHLALPAGTIYSYIHILYSAEDDFAFGPSIQ